MRLPGPQTFASVAFDAAESGDIAPVREHLAQGADPNVTDTFGFTPLQRAVQFDRQEMALRLLETGADVNVSTKPNKRGIPAGRTPLMTAAERGYTDMVRLLLDGGANPCLRDGEGWNALMRAVYSRHEDIVRLLVEAGAEVGLLEAAMLGNSVMVAQLLAAGADLHRDVTGEALRLAALIGQESVTTLLLDYGTEVDAQDAHGKTALMRAAAQGCTTTVQLLLGRSAAVDVRDHRGGTALMDALQSSQGTLPDVVRLLLDHGANVAVASLSGWTPLMLACLFGNAEVAEWLLQRGANPNVFTDEEASRQEGCTTTNALMMALGNGHVEAVRVLLRYGADVRAPNNGGRTVIELAERRLNRPDQHAQMSEIIGLLREAGAIGDESVP